jgi:hypothetical protein
MTINRKDFFKTACISGACLCGFGSLALSANANNEQETNTSEEQKKLELVQEYLEALLQNMQQNLHEDALPELLKSLASVHYKQLNMDAFLKPYEIKLTQFIAFLEKEWGWKVDYNPISKTIVANENKDHCVCPMLNLKTGIKPAAICYCSEGFAELMFAKAAGVPVEAKIVASIHRGDKQCIYKITLS